MQDTVVYEVQPILDDPRYEGFGYGAQQGIFGGTIEDDFTPEWSGSEWRARGLAEKWRPFAALGRVRPFNDYPCVVSIPAFSPRAVEGLRDILEPNGEILPFSSRFGTYYAYNLTTIVSALDVERSEVVRFSDGRILDIERYEFLPDRLVGLTIFQLQEYPGRSCVTEFFVHRVREAGLKGFEFVRLWPLPPGVDYRLLHKEAKAQRESTELPPGQTLKGNSVLIGLKLEGTEATESERSRVDRLADDLDTLLVDVHSETPVVGNLEQIEYTEGECWLSLSGPNADLLVRELRPCLRNLNWPTGFRVLKRYGEFYNVEAQTEQAEVS